MLLSPYRGKTEFRARPLSSRQVGVRSLVGTTCGVSVRCRWTFAGCRPSDCDTRSRSRAEDCRGHSMHCPQPRTYGMGTECRARESRIASRESSRVASRRLSRASPRPARLVVTVEPHAPEARAFTPAQETGLPLTGQPCLGWMAKFVWAQAVAATVSSSASAPSGSSGLRSRICMLAATTFVR